jgi:ribokinase
VSGRVLVVGPIHRVVLTDVERLPVPGGAELGTSRRHAVAGSGLDLAVAARRAGAATALVGAVGEDDAGRACAAALVGLGIEDRLQRHRRAATPLSVVARDPEGRTLTVGVPGARVTLSGDLGREPDHPDGPGLDDAGPGDVVLVAGNLPSDVAAGLATAARRRRARVVVAGAPRGSTPSAAHLLTLADPVVISEQEAAEIADAGGIPESLCVVFGRAGAVWDGIRVDSDDVRSPEPVPGATEAFGGTLAAVLAAGGDRRTVVQEAVAAARASEED